MNMDNIITSLSHHNWTCTNTALRRYCTELDPFTYAFLECRDDGIYLDNIDVRTYFSSAQKTKETESILCKYKYHTVRELEDKYGELWAQILAEFIFETIMELRFSAGTNRLFRLCTGTEDEKYSVMMKITNSAQKIPA